MAEDDTPEGVNDIKVADIKSTIQVLRVLADNVDQHQAYFKENAVEDIIRYLNKKLNQMRQEWENG